MATQHQAPRHHPGTDPTSHFPERFAMARSSKPGRLDPLLTFSVSPKVFNLFFVNQMSDL
jgi:hypothetical protein